MMNQNTAASACRSVFRQDEEPITSEKYTQLWITLINQIERGKQILSNTR